MSGLLLPLERSLFTRSWPSKHFALCAPASFIDTFTDCRLGEVLLPHLSWKTGYLIRVNR